MNRTWIVASLGFAAAYGAERLYSSMAKDIARYERMRAMSGQPPLLREVLSALGGLFGGAGPNNGAAGIIAGLTDDVVRYAKMKGM